MKLISSGVLDAQQMATEKMTPHTFRYVLKSDDMKQGSPGSETNTGETRGTTSRK